MYDVLDLCPCMKNIQLHAGFFGVHGYSGTIPGSIGMGEREEFEEAAAASS
jgi:hypothetical protein